MKKYKYILLTAGRGPIECGLAVQGVQMRFKKFLDAQDFNYEIVNQELGPIPRSIATIVFRVELDNILALENWLGTIQ